MKSEKKERFWMESKEDILLGLLAIPVVIAVLWALGQVCNCGD